MKKCFVFLSLGFFLVLNISAQKEGEWKLKNQKENISIYTRDVPDSNLKELKMSSEASTTLSGFVTLIREVETNPDWLQGNFSVERLGPKKGDIQYNRTVIDFPFPLSDRDIIGYATVSQNPTNKTVTISSIAVPDAYPKQSGYVRIPLLLSKWILTPTTGGKVKIEYFLRSDPGGHIPAWVTNMLLDVGPFRSFKAILKELSNRRFQLAKVPGVEEPDQVNSQK